MENNNQDKIMSDQLDQLFTALAKAQSEFTIATKDKDNPYYKSKYADWKIVVLSTREALTKNGLSVTQPPITTEVDGKSYLITILGHSSGQWIKSKVLYNPIKSDVQSLKSYNTSLKRMCYENIVGVITADEEDDDGNNASHDLNNFNYLLSLDSEKQKEICNHYKIEALKDLTIENAQKALYHLMNKNKK